MLTQVVHSEECEAASMAHLHGTEISRCIVSRIKRSEQGLTMQLRLALNGPSVSTSQAM